MKYILLGVVSLFTLTHCQNRNFSRSATEAIIGSWQHTENEVIIRFDENNHYTINIGGQAYQWKYQLDPSPPHNTFYIDDSLNQIACKFDLIDNDQLQLTLIRPSLPFDAEKDIATYYRVKEGDEHLEAVLPASLLENESN